MTLSANVRQPETLVHARERGASAVSWLGREQVKFWTLQERAAKLFRYLKKDYLFSELAAASKAAHQARVALLEEFEVAKRTVDKHRAKEAQLKISTIDKELRANLEKRDEWVDWRLYRKLGHEIDARLKAMRFMWEESEKAPFENAWKGEFGDR